MPIFPLNIRPGVLAGESDGFICISGSNQVIGENKLLHADYIDGLRAVAILSVMMYHLNKNWFPGGFVGVDIFFVISGFVVSMSASRLGNVGFIDFASHFYARRMARILPALIFCLLITFFVATLFIPPAWLSASIKKVGLGAFFGVSNFLLMANTGNYFAPSAEFNPYTHTWSLGVEEQFYFLFPLLFFIWLRGKKRLSFFLFFIFALISLGCSWVISKTHPAQAFYMIWSRFWELALGVLLFQGMRLFGRSFDLKGVSQRRFDLLAVVGVLMVAVGFYVAVPEKSPISAGWMSTIGVAIILGALHGRSGGFLGMVLTRKPMLFMGKISYSLYLWHWPVFVLFRWTVGLDDVVCQLVALIVTLLLSIFSYYFIERPPMRIAMRVMRPAVIFSGLGLAVAGYAAAAFVAHHQLSISQSVVVKNRELWEIEGTKPILAENGCQAGEEDVSSDRVSYIRYFQTGCDASNVDRGRVFVLGDSHAMHYRAMLKMLVASTGMDVYEYSSGGCSFVGLQAWEGDEECKKFRISAISDVLFRVRQGDIVFLPSLRMPRMVDQWGVANTDSIRQMIFDEGANAARAKGVAEALPFLRKMVDRGARVILEAPSPMLKSVPFRCSDWFNRGNPICAAGFSIVRSDFEELRGPVMNAYEQIRQQVPRVYVWDPVNFICSRSSCDAFFAGKPLFFDGDHFTFFANEILFPEFLGFLNSLPKEND